MNPDKKNDFDRKLAGKFDNFHPEVPNGLWDKIASKLDEQEQGGIIPVKRHGRFPTWWISVAASVLLVCGIVYWYNRPVAVTYLQSPMAHVEETEVLVVEEPAVPAPTVEPLDIDRLKRLFAKRNRAPKNENKPETLETKTPSIERPAETSGGTITITEETPTSTHALAKNGEPAAIPSAEQQSLTEEAVAATVPDIQPPVMLEEEEETLLAAAEASKQPFGVSSILNYVVGAVDQRDEKLVTFSNDGEGSLKLDFNFSLAKSKKKRTK
ncbi:hypothetical protein [Parapedobacter sp. 10938]|uniref:hypothetical protein n=1 Tax=Parapedobacter flavus TaxID=3110225 RepID=UPI002DB8D3ED|nr:hypothetical protein [Parapedobacter sp. 10938]MEC3880713.1 hypothetical protein [Parapedobacter sp. 10938]